MDNIYTSGDYLKATQTWHSEDSPWKAQQICIMLQREKLEYNTVVEVGCGSGAILNELSKKTGFENKIFSGYDISPQAILMSESFRTEKVNFFNEDLHDVDSDKYFDLLLAIDVFEHVPNYFDFLNKCRARAKYKIYHIPLDLHVSSIIRNEFIKSRYSIGHIHYFTADSALATLQDTGHEIISYSYTNGSIDLFMNNPSIKRAIANIPRWVLSKINLPLTARFLGGYSLLVLTK
jgi:SAM-dependent methyltransferase